MMKHHKYVAVSSCTVHDDTSDICASIYLYSTQRNIRNMCEYLVLEYKRKHQKYVAVSSLTVSEETSEIYLLAPCIMKHHKYVTVSSCTVHEETSEIYASI